MQVEFGNDQASFMGNRKGRCIDLSGFVILEQKNYPEYEMRNTETKHSLLIKKNKKTIN